MSIEWEFAQCNFRGRKELAFILISSYIWCSRWMCEDLCRFKWGEGIAAENKISVGASLKGQCSHTLSGFGCTAQVSWHNGLKRHVSCLWKKLIPNLITCMSPSHWKKRFSACFMPEISSLGNLRSSCENRKGWVGNGRILSRVTHWHPFINLCCKVASFLFLLSFFLTWSHYWSNQFYHQYPISL